jgi:murein DD-endopeptidase MepM/ murein hydrolase activator NlpD
VQKGSATSRLLAALVSAALATATAVLAAPAVVAGPSPGRVTTTAPAAAEQPAGRKFWVKDRHPYTSPWYRGEHRRMINFGCTRAPYYPASPECPRGRGFHHGVDVSMRCGNPLFAGLRGRVVHPGAAGALGSAYGPHAFRIRNAARGIDVVIGHTRRVFVDPGERVRRGQRIALASDAAAPDGCHLHFEVRPAGGGYLDARNPERIFRLDRQPIG